MNPPPPKKKKFISSILIISDDCFAKNSQDKQWYRFNDSIVSPIDSNNICVIIISFKIKYFKNKKIFRIILI